MKRLFNLALMLTLFFSLAPIQQKIKKYKENGVEIIVNPVEPCKVKGKPNNLNLEEKFSIDFEKNEIAESGLVDINSFEVNSKGDIYFLSSRSEGNKIFKFDKDLDQIVELMHL